MQSQICRIFERETAKRNMFYKHTVQYDYPLKCHEITYNSIVSEASPLIYDDRQKSFEII